VALRHQRRQAALDFGICLVPAGLFKHAVALDQRRAQAVRVLVQVFQRHALGADVAGAEDVGLVGADTDDFALLNLDFQTATGFA